MKLTLDATEQELKDKGPALVKALAERLGLDLHDLSHGHEGHEGGDPLEKSLASCGVHSDAVPKAIAQLQDKERAVVRQTYAAMMKEISGVFDKATGAG